MSFVVYDLAFLVLFSVGVILFLYTRKHNLQRHGILYLYKTKLGIKFIDRFASRFRSILIPMQYVVLFSGYVLMISVFWMIVWTTYLYWKFPILSEAISAPPVFPLIPYFPKLFGLESFFPPLYFTYFIIALGIVAVVHEFSHGIFARLHGFKIHSTGFAFLGPFLGAFVEPDEKQMAKAKKLPQMSVLAAGTFANVVMTVLFGAVMFLFFSSIFVPAGVRFDSYALTDINLDDIASVQDSEIEGYVEITTKGSPDDSFNLAPTKYYSTREKLDYALEHDVKIGRVLIDAPAFRAQIPIGSTITEINGERITSYEHFAGILQSHSPGEVVNLKAGLVENSRIIQEISYDIELDDRGGEAFLGVGFFSDKREGVIGFLIENTYNKMKNPRIYYESTLGDFGWFVFYLLWWIVVINLLVALFNMLPLGILDGGRFFYLTVLGITGSEKISKKSFSYITWFLLLLLFSMMIKWALRFF